jgi:orotidine-5'-phosphate decarboxylase
MLNTELVIALDYAETEPAEKLMAELKGLPVVYKVGLELFMSAGPAWVKSLCDQGHRIFLDLKFLDIPNTVGKAVLQGAQLGVEFMTLHLSGGRRMFDEVDTRLKESEISGILKKRPKILGVSVLTSFKEEDWIANVSHVAKLGSIRPIEDAVMHYSNLAFDHPAIHGMVCSSHEVESIRGKYPKLFLMVPGIRPKGASLNDQGRVMTPAEAMSAGASMIVVGRPITQSQNPREAAEDILKEIS